LQDTSIEKDNDNIDYIACPYCSKELTADDIDSAE
jgi:uncharacterized Zn-finger protein